MFQTRTVPREIPQHQVLFSFFFTALVRSKWEGSTKAYRENPRIFKTFALTSSSYKELRFSAMRRWASLQIIIISLGSSVPESGILKIFEFGNIIIVTIPGPVIPWVAHGINFTTAHERNSHGFYDFSSRKFLCKTHKLINFEGWHGHRRGSSHIIILRRRSFEN